MVRPAYRAFAGGPFVSTPIRAVNIQRMGELSNAVDWASDPSDTIYGLKTFAADTTISAVAYTSFKATTANIGAVLFNATQTTVPLETWSANWMRKTTLATQIITIPATDCRWSRQTTTNGERPGLINGAVGWIVQLQPPTYFEHYGYLTLPNIIPLGASITSIALTARIKPNSNYPAGSALLDGGIYILQDGSKRKTPIVSTTCSPVSSNGDTRWDWTTDISIESESDRLLIGLRTNTTPSIADVVLKTITIQLANVQRWAFDRRVP